MAVYPDTLVISSAYAPGENINVVTVNYDFTITVVGVVTADW